MEEESGNYIYIFFIIIGVALIAIGTFYYYTDTNIELLELDKTTEDDNKTKNEGQLVTSSDINMVDYAEGIPIALDGKSVTISTSIKGQNHSLDANGKSMGVISENSTINIYTIYDKFLLIEVNDGETVFNHYYIINSDARLVKDIYEMDNGTYTTSFENDRLNSSLVADSVSKVVYKGNLVDICNVEEVSNSNISLDKTAKASYKLLYYGENTFGIEIDKEKSASLLEVQSSLCNQ